MGGEQRGRPITDEMTCLEHTEGGDTDQLDVILWFGIRGNLSPSNGMEPSSQHQSVVTSRPRIIQAINLKLRAGLT
jgi:hypothetical protein